MPVSSFFFFYFWCTVWPCCADNGRVSKKRVLFGREFDCPEAVGAGSYGESTRWRLIRDGLESCIEHLPAEERTVVTRLQEIWAFAAQRAESLKGVESVWPTLF